CVRGAFAAITSHAPFLPYTSDGTPMWAKNLQGAMRAVREAFWRHRLAAGVEAQLTQTTALLGPGLLREELSAQALANRRRATTCKLQMSQATQRCAALTQRVKQEVRSLAVQRSSMVAELLLDLCSLERFRIG